MRMVEFYTHDTVRIVGNFYSSSERTERVLLCLHMMPSTKESWREFADQAVELRWNVLTIDLRGHGESTYQDGKHIDFQSFTDEEHQQSMLDIDASEQALSEVQDQKLTLTAIVGASIGANLALWYQSMHSTIQKTVLLSPGFNYRGIETKPFMSKLTPDQGVYLAGGSKDIRGTGDSSGDIVQSLYDMVLIDDKKADIIETQKHGTDLFLFDPDLQTRIFDWLK